MLAELFFYRKKNHLAQWQKNRYRFIDSNHNKILLTEIKIILIFVNYKKTG
jgi:hypothetical protein